MSGDLSGKVCISNLTTGECAGTLGSHVDSVESITFCKNDDSTPYCVSCGIDTNIHIYNLKEMKIREQISFEGQKGYSKV